MSNSRGVYVGAVLRVEVEKVEQISWLPYCPRHHNGGGSGNFCQVCGGQTEHTKSMQFPTGGDLLGDNERLYWLPNEAEYNRGVLYFASNITADTSVDTDFCERATAINGANMLAKLERFTETHAEDIAALSVKSAAVVFAVVPWYEF